MKDIKIYTAKIDIQDFAITDHIVTQEERNRMGDNVEIKFYTKNGQFKKGIYKYEKRDFISDITPDSAIFEEIYNTFKEAAKETSDINIFREINQ